MRFVLRGLVGLGLTAMAAAMALLAALHLAGTLTGTERPSARPAPERIHTVSTAVLEPVTAHPVIESHGTVRSWRTLTLRAPVAGGIVDIAERFRDGARVRAGEVLLRLDAADHETRVAEADSVLAEAQADVAEAEQGVTAAESERRAAETRRELRAASLDRQRGLADRGVASGATVEAAALALAAAEQEVASRMQAVVTAGLRVQRAQLAVRRAELALAAARRTLADTTVRAPFDGVVADTLVGPGDLVAVNGPLGQLVDPEALEVAFGVTSAVFARLLDSDGALRPLSVTVRLQLGDDALEATGTLDRAGAVAGPGGTGRTLFARLDADPGLWLKPGDFVAVRLSEPPLADVAVVPATAVSTGGELLVLDSDGRLDAVPTTVLRRERNRVILVDVPFGAAYVIERGPRLAAGLKARSRDIPAAPSETLSLDPDRRAALIAFVRADEILPADRRSSLLNALTRPRVPRAVVERLEARMTGG